MDLVTKRGKQLRKENKKVEMSERGKKLAGDMLKHLNAISLADFPQDRNIERQILEDELKVINKEDRFIKFDNDLVMFSPSSASKCERELFYKAMKEEKDEQPLEAYHKRWTRNSTAVHACVQKDLLYGEKLPNTKFTVERMEDGSPAWERNIKDIKTITHNGVTFQLFGMMDGVLNYTPDGSRIGFEFKTKSTTLGAIGEYKMKAPQEGHVEQAVAYSILFGMSEFIFVYESLAKDGWNKGKEAKPDIRTFHVEITDQQRQDLLDKLARVAKMYYAEQIPAPNFDKCIFCPFKQVCAVAEGKVVKFKK